MQEYIQMKNQSGETRANADSRINSKITGPVETEPDTQTNTDEERQSDTQSTVDEDDDGGEDIEEECFCGLELDWPKA